MAGETVEVVAGWTGRLDFQLLSDGAAVSLSTSDTVSPLLVDRHDTEVATSSGAITIITASSGEVGFTPSSSGTFANGRDPYSLRFKVVNGAGAVVFFPNADPVTIGVWPY